MPSRIYSMSFNTTSTLLCVSSATETIHIFKLGQPGSPQAGSRSPSTHGSSRSNGDESPAEDSSDFNNRKHNGTLMGMLRRTSQNVGSTFAATVGGYLPKGVTEIWEPQRDFAWIRIPKSSKAGAGATSGPLRSVVAMSSNTPQVMVVASDGNFYVFNIDLSKGGEGTLTKQYSYV